MRLARDLDIAEEATADAFVLALQTWPERGVPDSVEAWLLTAARRRAIDKIRRAGALRSRLAEVAMNTDWTADAADPAAGIDASPVEDDELRLVVLCCHPALAAEAQVALTLRLGCGAATAAIASAFLVPLATMAARLTRAKQRVARSGTGIDLPDDHAVDERLPAVRRVVHLAYTLGHTAGAGDDLRDDDLADRALRLARTLRALRPSDRETAGLLALIVLSQARAATRLGSDGDQVLLAAADRSRWDRALIDEGRELERFASAVAKPGALALQAAIAAEHATAASLEATRWGRLVQLHGALLELEPSPTVALGRCVAISYAMGPAAGLADLEDVMTVGRLEGYPYAHAARAQMLSRLGQVPESRRAWIRAASCARTRAERDFFTARSAG